MTLQASFEVTDYYEKHGDIFSMIDHNDKRKTIQMYYGPQDVEFTLKYTGDYPDCKYELIIDSTKYDEMVKRANSIWKTISPNTFEECLNQIHEYFKDDKRFKKEIN